MPKKPHAAFPNPAATLPGEADILANVLANLADHDAKLVYADWLEERDDPRGPLLREYVTAYRAGKKPRPTTASPKSWRELVGINLVTKARALHLTEHTDTLLRLAKPALGFKPTRTVDAKLAVGATKLGGCPDVPLGAKWPTWQGEPLAFLVQFDLCALSASPVCRELPATGLLSVFYAGPERAFDNEDKGGWRVFHFAAAAGLDRREFPEGLDEESRYKACRVAFTELLTLPERDSPWEKQLPLNNDEDLAEPYEDLLGSSGLDSRILGYASSLQNDVHGRKNVRHLLTIDSDDRPGWMWGDVGLLYFTMSEENLRHHRFDRVRFEYQSC